MDEEVVEGAQLDREQIDGEHLPGDAIDGHIARRGQVVEAEIARSGGFQLQLGASQLLVLQFQLDLVDFEYVTAIARMAMAAKMTLWPD